ncbi:FkbM family methyltransferase [Mucilaginibacter sp.]|uniref:FkbM family methyltransferase n=1 Tax=Mucilaginibacter sp. TaxID=1882438 RepID=UPI0032677C8B
MKRSDRIKLDFIRNWALPGKERLAHWLKPSAGLQQKIKDGIVWLNNEDIAIYTTADNYIEWTILSTGTYEDEINKLIRISLKPGDNALDIGGNIGLQSIRMSKSVGNTGRVYAFEPLNHLQKKFSKNMALNKAGNVTLFPMALSDFEGETEFSVDEHAWNQGTFSLNDKEGIHKQSVSIKIADNLTEVQALESLALIKIDVEGFEYSVLRGLAATLAKHKPRVIFEYDSNYWAKAGQSATECFSLLHSLNYQTYLVSSVGCELITGVEDTPSGNIFCISS